MAVPNKLVTLRHVFKNIAFLLQKQETVLTLYFYTTLVQRFNGFYYIQNYTKKANIRRVKRWRVQDLQPYGVRLAIVHPSLFTISQKVVT